MRTGEIVRRGLEWMEVCIVVRRKAFDVLVEGKAVGRREL